MNIAQRPTKLYIISGILCLVLLVFAHHKMRHDLFIAWQSGEYSHGMLIPFIALLIGWHRLAETKPEVRPSWWGVGLLFISGIFLTLGTLANFPTIGQYGFIISLLGITVAYIGVKAGKILAPAFIYLLFAIPLPHLVYANLSGQLQLISSNIGVFILEAVGISVFQEGNIIDLGEYKLQVVEACSGLRYLFPLMSFGYLVAYLLDDKVWKRVVIFLSTIPIAIGMNSLRIALVGIAVNIWGQEMAEGFLHDFEGWVIFLLCVALLIIELLALQRIGSKGHFRSEVFTIPHGRVASGNMRLSPPIFAAIATCITLAVVFGGGLADKRGEIIPRHKDFVFFPNVIGEWLGKSQYLEEDILRGLQLTDYLMADYKTSDEKIPINLYVAYYASQRIGSSAHSPANCIPGGGWQIVGKSIRIIPLKNGKKINVSRLLIRRGDAAQLVYYWFDERGRNVTETSYAKWYLMLDSIMLKRSDGALIRLITRLDKKEDEENADKRLTQFLFDSYPVIKDFLPDSGM